MMMENLKQRKASALNQTSAISCVSRLPCVVWHVSGEAVEVNFGLRKLRLTL